MIITENIIFDIFSKLSISFSLFLNLDLTYMIILAIVKLYQFMNN